MYLEIAKDKGPGMHKTELAYFATVIRSSLANTVSAIAIQSTFKEKLLIRQMVETGCISIKDLSKSLNIKERYYYSSWDIYSPYSEWIRIPAIWTKLQ